MPDVVSNFDDEELAQRVARRDAADGDAAVSSYEELFRRHAREVLVFLAARTHRSEAEDLLQRVWLKVWEKLPSQFSRGSFRAWLFQIARTQVIDNLRLRRTDPLGDATADIASRIGKPGDHLLDMERVQLLRDCLARLEEREAGVLRGLLRGEPFPDICDRLQIDSHAAGQAGHSARAKLDDCGAATSMKIHVLDLPDDPQRLRNWLEGQFVGLYLGHVVAELTAVHRDTGDDKTSLEDALGPQRNTVLAEGLSPLAGNAIGVLLQKPRLLLELQELVLTEGGEYWAQLVSDQKTDEQGIDAVRDRLRRTIAAPATDAAKTRASSGTPWYLRPWLAWRRRP